MVQALVRLLEEQTQMIAELRDELAQLREENRELLRAVLGPKSEKMPSVDDELNRRTTRTPEQNRKAAKDGQAKRKANRKRRRELPVVEKTVEPCEDALECQLCGGGPESFRKMGEEVSYRTEYVPEHLVREKHIRVKMACVCGACIVTAGLAPTVSEGVHYGPGLHAHTVVSKLVDSQPLYRQTERMRRAGAQIARSTLCDLFHRSADLLRPLADRIVERVSESPYVNADETSLKVQDKGACRRGFVWTFIADNLIAFVFSASRSGDTPRRLLEGTDGYLQVDGYSGYNQVCTPDSRDRVGCLAHLRRYFFKALGTAPDEARHGMEQILELYRVEYDAAEQGVLGSDTHLALRKTRSKKILSELSEWLAAQKPLHVPKSPLGRAITYAQNNWAELERFTEDVRLPLDNNISERALRIIALGRKNYLFAGHDVGAENLCVLQTLVATCQANDVNPQDYLADVLVRVNTHPASQIDDLLPDAWQPAHAA